MLINVMGLFCDTELIAGLYGQDYLCIQLYDFGTYGYPAFFFKPIFIA